jgi:hypothetical protein
MVSHLVSRFRKKGDDLQLVISMNIFVFFVFFVDKARFFQMKHRP